MTEKLTVAILAAGMGTRLGKPHPKCLTVLDNGETIMERQLRIIRNTFGDSFKTTIVVGFQSERIVEMFPNETYIYNPDYDVTNTSKSLLKVLQKKNPGGVLWLNGDVVFDEDLISYVGTKISQGENFVSVNSNNIGDEEVKYTLDPFGNIDALSKVVPLADALGEAVGINYVNPATTQTLKHALNHVADQDYFEKAIELSITNNDSHWVSFDITKLGLSAVEVDFGSDLVTANEHFFAPKL